MSLIEQLYYLVREFNKNNYSPESFCSEFHRIFVLEIDTSELSSQEFQAFGELYEVVGRFSVDAEDVKNYGYYSEIELRNKTKEVERLLCRSN